MKQTKPRYNELIDYFCAIVSVIQEGEELAVLEVNNAQVLVPITTYEKAFFNQDEQNIFERYHATKGKAVEFIVFRSNDHGQL